MAIVTKFRFVLSPVFEFTLGAAMLPVQQVKAWYELSSDLPFSPKPGAVQLELPTELFQFSFT